MPTLSPPYHLKALKSDKQWYRSNCGHAHYQCLYSSCNQIMRHHSFKRQMGKKEEKKKKKANKAWWKHLLPKMGRSKCMLDPNIKLFTHGCPMSCFIHLFLGEWWKAFISPSRRNSARIPMKYKEEALCSPKGLGMISGGKTCNMIYRERATPDASITT